MINISCLMRQRGCSEQSSTSCVVAVMRESLTLHHEDTFSHATHVFMSSAYTGHPHGSGSSYNLSNKSVGNGKICFNKGSLCSCLLGKLTKRANAHSSSAAIEA
eukprot:jgi/Botrbrau1/11731/Bobra.0195s0058.1